MIKSLSKRLSSPEEPATAIEPVIVVVMAAILAGLLVFGISNWRAGHRDNERRADIAGLQKEVAEYRALHGSYPVNLQALANIPPQYCQAPKSHGNCQKPDYTYVAFKAGTIPSVGTTQDCTNKKTACAGFIIYTNSMEQTTNPYYLRSY